MSNNPSGDDAFTLVEQVTITVDGQKIPGDLMEQLLRVEVDSTLEMPNMFELTFRDDALEWTDGGPFELGKTLTVDFKLDDGSFTTIVSGEVTGVEPEFSRNYIVFLKIRGYDKSHRLNRGKTSQAFVNVTDADVVKKLGSGVSIQADATSGTRKHIFQDNQTSLAFIHRLARLNGFEVFADGSELKFTKMGTERGEVKLKWGSSLHYFYPRMSVSTQVNEVQVKGWDPSSKQPIIGKATTSKIHPAVNVGGSGGDVSKSGVSASIMTETHYPVMSQGEADAIAQSILDEVNGHFIEADGRCDGNPSIVAGTKLSVDNLGKQFSGSYQITSARHVYSTEGYHVDFIVSGARPFQLADLTTGASLAATDTTRWSGFYPAIVTDNDDPDKMGRVKLKYPWFNENLESGWARVAMAGAGSERGIHWLPEINDEVLVAFGHGDFNQPYVIGGLYNGVDKEAQQKAVRSGKVEDRVMRTRIGHRLSMQDQSGDQRLQVMDNFEKNRFTQYANKPKTYIGSSVGDMKIQAGDEIKKEAGGNYRVTTLDTFTAMAARNLWMQSPLPIVLLAGGYYAVGMDWFYGMDFWNGVGAESFVANNIATATAMMVRTVKDIELTSGGAINISAGGMLTLKGKKVNIQPVSVPETKWEKFKERKSTAEKYLQKATQVQIGGATAASALSSDNDGDSGASSATAPSAANAQGDNQGSDGGNNQSENNEQSNN